jgi:hypothetical protein
MLISDLDELRDTVSIPCHCSCYEYSHCSIAMYHGENPHVRAVQLSTAYLQMSHRLDHGFLLPIASA